LCSAAADPSLCTIRAKRRPARSSWLTNLGNLLKPLKLTRKKKRRRCAKLTAGFP
jgi:hypothetical protein